MINMTKPELVEKLVAVEYCPDYEDDGADPYIVQTYDIVGFTTNQLGEVLPQVLFKGQHIKNAYKVLLSDFRFCDSYTGEYGAFSFAFCSTADVDSTLETLRNTTKANYVRLKEAA